MYLCDLKQGNSSYIKKINGNNDFIIRLYNMGLVEGTNIKLILQGNNIKAYSFRNTLIALRDKDALNILIGDYYD